jgi:2-haloacid dehalogenase
MPKINTIIFDLGSVLIDWNPEYVFKHYFETDDEKEFFFSHVCTMDWNEDQDAGKPIDNAVAERIKLFPDWEKPIRDYYDRWPEMLKGTIPESVEIFRELKKNGSLRFYALTNWSHELFPIALGRFDFLFWFDGRVVSGEEKIRKPFPEIYERLLDRYQVNRKNALFIDDNLRNVKAAEALDISSIHFQNPDQLRSELQLYGLL